LGDESGQLAKLIEEKITNGFNIVQEKMTEIIEVKIKSIIDSKADNPTNSNLGSYATAVGENKNARVVELKNIMAATRNEELAEQAAQKRRANNLILHGRGEFSPGEDNIYIKQMLVHLESPGVTAKVERIGKTTENKIRPIRISFETEAIKDKVYTSLFKLKGNNLYKGIHITDDYTFNERKLIRDFNQQAKEKTSKEEDQNSIWRVRGSPKNGLFLKKFMKSPPHSLILTQ